MTIAFFEVALAYQHPDDLDEHTVVEIDPAGGIIIAHNLEWSCANLTKPTTFRLYREIDGAYVLRGNAEGPSDSGVQFWDPADGTGALRYFWLDFTSSTKTKLTAQTTGGVSEGAARDIHYQYGYEA